MAIKFDYQQTMQQAQALEQMASDLSGKTKSRLSGVKETLGAAWTGRSGKTFVKFLTEAEADLDAKAKYLRAVSEYLKKSAKQIRDAEEGAKNSASRIS